MSDSLTWPIGTRVVIDWNHPHVTEMLTKVDIEGGQARIHGVGTLVTAEVIHYRGEYMERDEDDPTWQCRRVQFDEGRYHDGEEWWIPHALLVHATPTLWLEVVTFPIPQTGRWRRTGRREIP
jgi:hypothetical protein